MRYTAKKMFMVLLALISICIMASISCAEIDEADIVGMWLFEEGNGDVAMDSSLNANDAVFNGGPKWDTGKFGGGILFDGADDYLSAEDSDSLDVVGEAITLLAWVDSEGWNAGWNHIIRKVPSTPRYYILGVHDTALAFVFLMTDVQQFEDIQGVNPMPTGEWLHLAMTYNGEEIAIYANGEVETTVPASGEIPASDGELRIGRGDPAGYFTGIIDEVGIFRVALSQDEIKEIMSDGLEAAILSVEPMGKLVETWGNIKANIRD